MRHPRGRGGPGIRYLIDRRTFLAGGLGLLLAPRALARSENGSLERALEESGFVYISPLLADGGESTCHGEVWFAWIDGAVVITTGSERWKARALKRGLDRARIWVGDHGPWKKMIGHNEAFRKAPSLEARAEAVKDEALHERLLAIYARKYPAEIGKWRDRMRQGHADGTRTMIRYTATQRTQR